MDISSILSAASTQGDTSAPKRDAKSLGKEDFLMLLVTQLSNQNPMEPMDNMDFIAQLAQFGQLEATTNLGDYLGAMESYMASINNFGAADLVGKEIKAMGDKVEISGSDPVTLNYDLKESAVSLTVNIYSSDDVLVKSISVGSTEAGEHQTVWDGTDISGRMVSPGTYTFGVNAKDGTDTAVDVTTFIEGVVDKAVFVSGIPYLHVGSQEVPLKNVLEIRELSSG